MSKPKVTKIPAVIHWTSKDRKYVIVSGPLPGGLLRSETRKTLDSALKMYKSEDFQDFPDDFIYSRNAVKNGYAITLSKLITEKENQWGEISL